MQNFQIASMYGPITAFSLCHYHKYWLSNPNGGERIKNPMFDQVSANLLDLKSEGNKKFDISVKYFAEQLESFISKSLARNIEYGICLVPSSKAGKYSPGLKAIVQRISKKTPEVHDDFSLIARTKDIAKLANGGSRDISVHRQSLKLNAKVKYEKAYILLDDIATTGRSLEACTEILLLNKVNVRLIVPVVLGKTI